MRRRILAVAGSALLLLAMAPVAGLAETSADERKLRVKSSIKVRSSELKPVDWLEKIKRLKAKRQGKPAFHKSDPKAPGSDGAKTQIHRKKRQLPKARQDKSDWGEKTRKPEDLKKDSWDTRKQESIGKKQDTAEKTQTHETKSTRK